MITPSKLEVRDSDINGRGVFATSDILEGEIIEEAYFIELTGVDFKQLEGLREYVYNFPIFKKNNCVVLGFGSIYNHSSEPLAYWETDEEKYLFRFIALRDILQGTEIVIDYKKPSTP